MSIMEFVEKLDKDLPEMDRQDLIASVVGVTMMELERKTISFKVGKLVDMLMSKHVYNIVNGYLS